jgi:hypothetical protein
VMVVLEPGIAKIGCAAEPKWVRNEPSPNKLLAGARALSEDLQAVFPTHSARSHLSMAMPGHDTPITSPSATYVLINAR